MVGEGRAGNRNVIAGLDPAIQLLSKRMDGRVKPGHDDCKVAVNYRVFIAISSTSFRSTACAKLS